VQLAATPNPEEPIKLMIIKNTTHHQLLSHLWLLHPQFQHLVMRDTSLGRRRGGCEGEEGMATEEEEDDAFASGLGVGFSIMMRK